jgi:preprotein translocase subunit SecA
VSLPQNQIRKMDSEELEQELREAAIEQINNRDCSGLLKYLEPMYAERELSAWAKEKFSIEVDPKELLLAGGREGERKPAEEIVELIETRAREAYARREIEYPVDHMLAFAFGGTDGQTVENAYAGEYVRAWARAKYGVEIPLEHLRGMSIRKLRDELIGYQEKALKDGGLDAEFDKLFSGNPPTESVVEAFNKRFGGTVTPTDLTDELSVQAEEATAAGKPAPTAREVLFKRARGFLRHELTDLEQFVLIQIFDQTWKDHLYAMDMLKGSVGLSGFAEKDPRIVYKKEGFEYFQQMMQGVRDKVTDLIFRARIVGAAQTRNAYRETAAVHEEAGGYGVAENMSATAGVTQGGEMQAASEQAQGEGAKVKTITRDVPKVGRNDPCPCGSGKKYKKCCGAQAA